MYRCRYLYRYIYLYIHTYIHISTSIHIQVSTTTKQKEGALCPRSSCASLCVCVFLWSVVSVSCVGGCAGVLSSMREDMWGVPRKGTSPPLALFNVFFVGFLRVALLYFFLPPSHSFVLLLFRMTECARQQPTTPLQKRTHSKRNDNNSRMTTTTQRSPLHYETLHFNSNASA